MERKILCTALFVALIYTISFSQKIVWKPKASLPVPCFGGEAVTCNNKIYIFGPGSNGELSDIDLLAYDIANNTWAIKEGKNIGGSHIAVNSIDSTVYIFGGGDNFNNTDIYHPETNTWTVGATMPTGRVHIKGAVLDGKIYVMGGYSSDYNNILSINEVYDPQTNTWEQKAPIPEPRENLKISVINNKIYIFGGNTQINSDFIGSTIVYAYDPSTDSWEQITTIPTTRYLHAIATVEQQVILACGYVNDNPSGRVDIYDLEKNTWIQANSLCTETVEMPYAEMDSSIYILGGRNDGPIDNLPLYDEVYEGVLISEGNFIPESYIPLSDTFAIVNVEYSYAIPDFSFIDDDTLTYSAKLLNGADLPGWLDINSTNKTFSGTPEEEGILDIIVTATDNYGASATDTFQIIIRNKIDISFIGNCGFLIEGNNTKILVDGLYNPWNGIPSDYTLNLIQTGQYPFNDLDFYLTTHNHGDHFNAGMVANFLRNIESVNFIGPENTANTLLAQDESSLFNQRVLGITPVRFQFVDTTVKSMNFRVLRMLHDADPGVDNIAFLFEIDGVKILHIGDFTGEGSDAFTDLDTFDLENEDIDIALLNYYSYFSNYTVFHTGQEIMEQVRDKINAKNTILYHIAENELVFVTDSVDRKYNIRIFQKSMDRIRYIDCGDTLMNVDINSAPVLVNPIPDNTTMLGQPIDITIPSATFNDSDENDNLVYLAQLSNGNELPGWLTFNDGTRRFNGTPDTAVSLNIRLIAVDNYGGNASAVFGLVINTSSIESQFINSEFLIFPNPATDQFTVSFGSNPIQEAFITICNLQGTQVFSKTFCNTTNAAIDLTGNANGIYIISASTQKNVFIRKILKE